MRIKTFKLFESHSLSVDVMEWTEFIYGVIIRHGIPIFMKSTLTNDLHTEVEIDGEWWDVEAGVVQLNGPKFDNIIKHHISKDNELQIRNFDFELSLTIMPEEIWSVDYYSGSFGDSDAFVTEEDQLEGARLNLDIYLTNSLITDARPNVNSVDKFLKNYNIRAKVYEIVSHEMDHCYEFYMRRERDANIFPERLLNFLIATNQDYAFANVAPEWQDFLRLCYLHLSFEQNARVTQLYNGLVDTDIDDIEYFWQVVKESSVWEELIQLKDFDAKKFYDNLTIDAESEDLKDIFVDQKFFTKQEVQNEDIKNLVLKHLISHWNDTIDEVNTEFEQYGDVKLEKVPKSSLENPMNFLKFFEKRFHKKWDKFYKKICKFAPVKINKEFYDPDED